MPQNTFSNGAALSSVRSTLNDNANDAESRLDALEGQNEFTTAEQTKLSGIETGATADQTGAEIEAALDSELGNTDWKLSGGASATETPVVLLMGQSNAVGEDSVNADPNALLNLEYQRLIPNAQIWDHTAATPAWVDLGAESLTTGKNLATAADNHGPELALMSEIGKILPAETDLRLIKWARGGSRMRIDLPDDTESGSWHPNYQYQLDDQNTSLDSSKSLYLRARDEVRDALANLAGTGVVPKILGVVWVQGESDLTRTDLGDASGYGYAEDLRLLITRFNEDIGVPMLPWVLMSMDRVNKDTVDGIWDEQRKVAEWLSNVSVVDFGWSGMVGSENIYTDGTHYSADGYEWIGRLCARELMSKGAAPSYVQAPSLIAPNYDKPISVSGAVGGFSDMQFLPKSTARVYWGVYTQGSLPLATDVRDGTGAGFQSGTSGNADLNEFLAMTAASVSGLSNDQSYTIAFVVTENGSTDVTGRFPRYYDAKTLDQIPANTIFRDIVSYSNGDLLQQENTEYSGSTWSGQLNSTTDCTMNVSNNVFGAGVSPYTLKDKCFESTAGGFGDRAAIEMPSNLNGNTYYLSALMRFTNITSNGGHLVGIGSTGNQKLGIGSLGNGDMGLFTSSSTETLLVGAANDTDYFVVARITSDADGLSTSITGQVYTNASSIPVAEPTWPTAAARTNGSNQTFNQVFIDRNSSAGQYYTGPIRVGSTWESVTNQ